MTDALFLVALVVALAGVPCVWERVTTLPRRVRCYWIRRPAWTQSGELAIEFLPYRRYVRGGGAG